MKEISIKELLTKYALGQCSDEESLWVENWYKQQDNELPLPISHEEFKEDISDIYNQLERAETRVKRWINLKIAASLIGVFLGMGMLHHYYKVSQPSDVVLVSAQDVAPVENKATLFLSNGLRVALDQLSVGQVFPDESLNIRKAEDGKIEYVNLSKKGSASVYNELHTNEGGQYKVELVDGTKVWLNASSSLRYPVPFHADKRVVELSGEAYFEVAQQGTSFYVKTDQQTIEVLGTHFNVNAYETEKSIKTTLLEGAVKIISKPANQEVKGAELILKPGEQAILNKNNAIEVKTVDPVQTIAWKNGLFSFQGEDLRTVMREFSRWYGVEVKFEGEVPKTKLWGQVYRNVSASEALKVLEYFGLKFKIINDKGISKIEISEK